MSAVGRWCAIAAAVLAVVTAATWMGGGMHEGARSGVADAGPDGAQLFRAKGCAGCHTGPEISALVSGFPPLTDASRWAGERRPRLTPEGYLAESMIDPGAFISPAFTGGNGPATAMPRLELSTTEVELLVAYLLRG